MLVVHQISCFCNRSYVLIRELVSIVVYGCFLVIKSFVRSLNQSAVTYYETPLLKSKQRLKKVKRKILVLDLDETLIHSTAKNAVKNQNRIVTQNTANSSNDDKFKLNNLPFKNLRRRWQENRLKQTNESYSSGLSLMYKIFELPFQVFDIMLSLGNMLSTRFVNRNVTPPDFQLDLMIQREKIEFLVRKRPHVDLFLKKVAKWYDLVVFTASLEMYGSEVCDMLERDSGIKFKAKYYRQHCVQENPQSFTKDLKIISNDMANIFIIDNSPNAYKLSPDNAIPIKSFVGAANDDHLLGLLPMLDCLRFCSDVRNILCRN